MNKNTISNIKSPLHTHKPNGSNKAVPDGSFGTVLKTLPHHIRRNGFNYTFLLRGKRSAIFKQTVTESVEYYEVFQIRVKPETIIKGKVIPAHEWFPHNEAYGYWAWTIRVYEDALWRFNELEAGKKRSEFTYTNSERLKYPKQ